MTAAKIEAGDFVQSFCTKCKNMTKHIAVGLLLGVPTKVQCTVCKGNHNFKKNPASSATPRQKAAPKLVDNKDWVASAAKWDETKATPYTTIGMFKKGELLNHSTFGLGLVQGHMGPKRMQVLFQNGPKLMLCGN